MRLRAMRYRIELVALFGAVLITSCASPVAPPATAPSYPLARRGDVVEDHFGIKVQDPYRWMEDANASETRDWCAAQQKMTESFLNTPARAAFKAELTRIWNYPKEGAPFRRGNAYFVWRNNGLQNQSVLYRMDQPGGPAKMMLDPNTFSTDGAAALRTCAFSHDGRMLAYSVSASGSDCQDIRVRDLETGKDLPDLVRWSKFTDLGWNKDNSGFFYNRYPKPGTVPPAEENNHCTIYFHRVGTPQEQDGLVLDWPQDKTQDMDLAVTDNGDHLIVYLVQGTSTKLRLFCRPNMGDPARRDGFTRLTDKADANYLLVGAIGSTLYVSTDLDAPRGKIIAVDLDKPARQNWKTIIPESQDTLDFATMVDGQIVVVYLADAHSVLRHYRADGTFVRDIPLPGIGTVGSLNGRTMDRELFFDFSSYAFPPSSYRYDPRSGRTDLLYKAAVPVDTSEFETRQVFARSKDGTRVPLFITCKRGLALDGSHPTLLYGYGGYGLRESPDFRPSRLIFMQRGGIYAHAILRGGGEYGEQWHQDGALAKKQNCFDDFLACGQYLVDQKYTSPAKLAIDGASNGGLLVGACMVQRPDLFSAVICGNPILDMVRYTQFPAGIAWIPEFGDPAKADDFKWLYAYSPPHNVKPGVSYPAALVLTAESDDRVDPSHAKKFVATLQAAQANAPVRNPILLRLETRAGHGQGKSTSKAIDEAADVYGFLFRIWGME